MFAMTTPFSFSGGRASATPALSVLPDAMLPRRPAFLTPLMREDLFDVGADFPREELTRRVLSLFWRDCCCPTCFSRAPAPVVELASGGAETLAPPRRLRAWWLLHDGILEDSEGPYSERLRPYFGVTGRNGRLWPRYEFRVVAEPALTVELGMFADAQSSRGHRLVFAVETGGRLRVMTQEPLA